MIDSLRGVLGIAFCLGFAILVHEFGHFLWAKICRVRVLKFSIGFGKFLFKWTYKGTEYGVAWFPFGGFVMMHGAMNPETGQAIEEAVESSLDSTASEEKAEPEKPEGEKRGKLQGMMDAATSDSTALFNKPYYQKVLIYSGGVAMNWITAVVTVGLIYTLGFDMPKSPVNVVGAVEPTSEAVASQIPLKPGDLILSVDGKPVEDWKEFQTLVLSVVDEEALKNTETPAPAPSVAIQVERPDEGTVTVSMDAYFQLDGEVVTPLSFMAPRYPAYIEDVFPNKPADKAGLQSGDKILAINGKEILDWDEMASIIRGNPGVPLEIQYQRADTIATVIVVPDDNPKMPGTGQLGIMPGDPERTLRKEPIHVAFAKAPWRTVRTTGLYVYTFVGIFERLFNLQFRAVGEDLGGPIQIAQLAYRSARRGLIDFLWLFFSINIALAVFNIIPIPLLDGSLLFFATYEAIARKPFPPRLHIPLLYAGLVLIILMFIAISVNDVLRIVR